MPQLQSSDTLAISVDVEEYFHAANLSDVCPVKLWHGLPSRVEYSTHRLLDLFDEYDQKGTFFFLGYCAGKYPALVREIVNRGHELASHGYAHKSAYLQNRKQFERDTRRSKSLLEDISGIEVIGYRAPNFSIRDENLWAYDVLCDAGYRYDSSLYPVYHHRYGNPYRSTEPDYRTTESGTILILPLLTFSLGLPGRSGLRFPVAGGAYWRVLPSQCISWILSSTLSNAESPVICYFHPWETDPDQPFFSSLSPGRKIRHYTGLSGFEKKLKYVFSRFRSGTIQEVASPLLDELKV
jgi:polysaccharide deacetylase family protein (PEP-CTERM system associated)